MPCFGWGLQGVVAAAKAAEGTLSSSSDDDAVVKDGHT